MMLNGRNLLTMQRQLANAANKALEADIQTFAQAKPASTALFAQRFRDTLRHGGHRLLIQVARTKGEHITYKV